MTITGDVAKDAVYIDGKKLSPKRSQKLVNHSPDGFAWGYGGSGPAQLALALMLEYCESEEMALRLYQQFKFDVVSGLEPDFKISELTVIHWIADHAEEALA